MSKNPSSEGLGLLHPGTRKIRKSPEPSTAESRLRDFGFTRAEAYAMRAWIGRNTIEKDFSPAQFAKKGRCSESTFSRAKTKKLLPMGLIVQVSDHVAPNRSQQGGKGVSARYRFTKKAYQIVHPTVKNGLADCTLPLAFEVPISRSKPKVQPHHSKHGHVIVADKNQNLLEEQKHLAEALTAQPSPGLNSGGALAAARATSSEEAAALLKAGPAFLSYLLEELKPQATKTPQALLVARLKDSRSRRELVAAGTAWIRRREATVATGDVTGLAGDLTPSLAVAAWKVAIGRMPAPSAAGYTAAYDLERSAWKACLDVARREDPARSARIESQLAERIIAQGIQPGSLVWSRALAHGISRDLAEATPWLREALSKSRQGSGNPEWVRDRVGGRTGAAKEHRPHA